MPPLPPPPPPPSPAGSRPPEWIPLHRGSGRALLFIAGLLGGIFLALGLIGTAAGSRQNGTSTGVRIAGGLLCLAGLVWLIRAARRGSRAAFGTRPGVAVGDGWITLQDRVVLDDPIQVRSDQIRAIAVDPALPRRRRGFGTALARFPVAVGGSSAYLWNARQSSRLPRLGHVRDVPNVAIVLSAPIAAPRVRGPGRGWFFGQPPHGRLRRGEPLPGLLLTVEDPDRAAGVLRAAGEVRALAAADLDPIPRESKAQRRQVVYERLAFGGFFVYTAVQVAAALGAFG